MIKNKRKRLIDSNIVSEALKNFNINKYNKFCKKENEIISELNKKYKGKTIEVDDKKIKVYCVIDYNDCALNIFSEDTLPTITIKEKNGDEMIIHTFEIDKIKVCDKYEKI